MAPPKSARNRIVSNVAPSKGVPPHQGKKSPGTSPVFTEAKPVHQSIDYARVQEEEIEALQAIYMEDYEEIETKGAWSKTSDRAFRLRIKSLADDDMQVTLSVRFTATYPKTLPLLSIESTSKLRAKTRRSVEKLVAAKPKELLGEVMIYEIASSIQEMLGDEVVAREHDDALGSLKEEHAVHEAAAQKLALEEEAKALRKKQEEKEEEERVLKQMVDEEIARRKEIKRKSKNISLLSPSIIPKAPGADCVSFDRTITVQSDGVSHLFSAVTLLSKIRGGPVTEVWLGQPLSNSEASLPFLVVKRATLKNISGHENRLKRAIQEFEDEMEDLKRLRQSSLNAVLDFKLEKMDSEVDGVPGGWQINVLTEYASKGSLSEFLETMDTLPVQKTRSWTIELLEALDYLHRNGVVHRSIHPNNILLTSPPNGGQISVRLSDGGFQENIHGFRDICRGTSKSTFAMSAYWVPPELSQDAATRKNRKTDVWDLGIVFLQMLFGLQTPEKYSSPNALIDSLDISEPLHEIIRKFFKPDPKKRPSAFDLIPCEFLRNDVPALSTPNSFEPRTPSSSVPIPIHKRLRRESSAYGNSNVFSRYASEWVEAGRLGKGGYGEVVKARNKLDGQIYAIKKIKGNSAAALTEVLSEVMLLSRLNHPYVVRYFSAWPEDDFSGISETEESTSVAEDMSTVSRNGKPSLFSAQSTTGGLDFISSSGLGNVEFGEDSDEDSDEEYDDDIIFEEDTEEDSDGADSLPRKQNGSRSPLKLRRTISSPRPPRHVKTTLYIQMEYCERHTLRDLIRKGFADEQELLWRLFRQILEGLAHIHSHGIIHRDLKPDNIFIDVTNSPRIGDFGLATSGQYHLADRAAAVAQGDGDMTRSIGTALYVAPELRSGVGGSYNEKVDMYSLGIIFFEMCHPLRTAMERDQVIRQLREKQHTLPSEFQSSEKALQGSIIESLISHRPSERPSSAELLRNGKLPLQIEDESIKEAVKTLADPSSAYHQKMMSALFSQTLNRQVKDVTWDMGANSGAHSMKDSDVVLQTLVKDRLISVFRRHGAVESKRPLLFPRSPHYANSNVVQLLDPSGTLVQLPFDLTLPHARVIARNAQVSEKSYCFADVFRDTYTGGAPRTNGEADFDIVSYDTKDLGLKEAEVIKVMDEIIEGFPSLASAQMCFHLNHSDLIELIMDYCRINVPQRPAVKEVLSKLNIQGNTWQKIRNDLRAPTIGVSSTSLDDLAKFDWRDTPEKSFAKIRSIFHGTDYIDKSHAIFAHLSQVITYLKQFKVRRKIYISPLSSFNEKFYSGGLLFQCLYDTKKRDVLAAGGRYDRLIREFLTKGQSSVHGYHAVGINIGWDRIVTSMARFHRNAAKSSFLKKAAEEEVTGYWATRRCDVLVASFDSQVLRSTGVKMVGDLWSNDLSAELAVDTRSPEELLAHYRDDKHSWIIIIKHDAPASGKPDLKVKSFVRNQDTDIRSTDLLSYLRAEIRERDHAAAAASNGASNGSSSRLRLFHQGAVAAAAAADPSGLLIASPNDSTKANVQVLVSQHRSKKTSKWTIIESAQSRAKQLLSSYVSAPIAAIETKDEVMDLLRETRLSDPDGWRRVIQSVRLEERQYLQDVHAMLDGYRRAWKETGSSGEGRVAFVYNFRTGGMILYDLGL